MAKTTPEAKASATPETNTFYIGLSMAGAISAGAYSAGVFDMLMEALEAWQQKKDEEKDKPVKTVPTHNVVISVISGASAGGIVGALGAVALADEEGTKKAKAEGKPYTLPRLYHAWVTMPQFASNSGHPDFLKRDDLDKSGLQSLLNKNLLPKICQRSFENFPEKIATARAYIAKDLHLFLTHTNLNGVPYGVPFTLNGKNQVGYPMMNHADRVHYRLAGLGRADFSSQWADKDPAVTQDMSTLHSFSADWTLLADPKQAALSSLPWVTFINDTLATGAFPIALQARIVSTNTGNDYTQRQWPIVVSDTYKKAHDFCLQPMIDPTNESIPYLAVDGGMTNNEPFELCRFTLMENPPESNPRKEPETEKIHVKNNDEKKIANNAPIVDRAVIMIDPFPEAPEYTQHSLSNFTNDDTYKQLNPLILNVLSKLFPTLKNQVRCKFDEMAAAYDEDVYSRFLIAPSKGNCEHPLACGLLGGFGGFLSEKLRQHDYQLGRYNCYKFLKNHFGLPTQYCVTKSGYHNGSINNYTCGDPKHYQLIPIMPDLVQPIPLPTPNISRKEFEDFLDLCTRRADALFKASRRELGFSGLSGIAPKFYWWASGSNKIKKLIRKKVADDLITFKLSTEDYSKPQKNARPRRPR